MLDFQLFKLCSNPCLQNNTFRWAQLARSEVILKTFSNGLERSVLFDCSVHSSDIFSDKIWSFSKYSEMKWPGEIRGFTNGEYHTVEDPESIVVKVISSRSLNLSRCYLAPKVHWIRSQFKGASTMAQVTNCIRRN